MKILPFRTDLLPVLIFLGCAAIASDSNALTFTFKTYKVQGQLQTWLTGINNNGVIVGWYLDQQGNSHGFSLTNGNFTEIDDPNGSETEIWGINTDGDMVGFYYDPCVEELCYEGFLYHGGKFTDIGPPWFETPPEDDSPDSEAFGLNDNGALVGLAGDGFGSEVGFERMNHNYTKLQVPNVNGEYAAGINNAGLVTLGWATNTSFGVSMYDGQKYTDISVPGATDTYEGGINNLGDFVLGFDKGLGQPIQGALLHAGKYHTFFDPKSTYLTLPLGINDKNTIVGVWNNGQQDVHVYGFIARYKR
jgi:hypothetical protein